MKTLVYCAVLLWLLTIPLNFAFAADSNDISYHEIYDIYHKKKYTITIQDVHWEEKIILALLENDKVLDTMTVLDARGVKKSQVLAEVFLSITFPVRGGTGIGIEFTKLFSVKAGKLYESMVLLTNYRSQHTLGEKKEIERYDVFFSVQGDSYKDFTLNVNESQYLDDKTENPPRQEDWEKTFTIPFNTKEMIFTNSRTTLNGEFTLVFKGIKTKIEKRKLQNKKAAKLTLRDQELVYIDNKWFGAGKSNFLVER